MTDIAHLFADLTGQIEDLHGLAVEGQAADQPTELLRSLADNIATGIKKVARTLLDIQLSLPDE